MSDAALNETDHPLSTSSVPSRTPDEAAEVDPAENLPAEQVWVPQLIAKVCTDPGKTAFVCGLDKLTYGELNIRSNQIAHLLRLLGVRTDMPVGIFLERSAAAFTAALAIMKAGGAYLPLDTGNPPDRLALMLKDACPQVVITKTSLAHLLPAGTHVLCLDAEGPAIESQSAQSPLCDITSGQLAYLIYTSGSTGQPKGVQITHAGLSNLVTWHNRAFAVTDADQASQVANFGFDAAVWEVWPYLSAGATVHVLPDVGQLTAEDVRDWMVAQEITIGFLPTPLAERVMQLGWPARTALRTLLTGADTLHTRPPAHLPFALINNYGPTECAVVATSGIVSPNQGGDALPSIGKPIDCTEIYILDQKLGPAPAGTMGELYIAGAGLARGYLNRPDLTAERFIANPYRPGTRLYKTGDLARLLPDGEIAFMGRVDDQIKLRGYRIDPDEIVTVLNRHPAVKTSSIATRGDDTDDQRLLAYVVLHPGELPAQKELQTFLQSQLPDYMVPATFVQLGELPLTSNGKVNRAALPPPDANNVLPHEPSAAPKTVIEQQMATVLAKLLDLNEVGIDEDFFALGGHSLLAAQVIARVRDQFDVEIPLRVLFDGPTIAELSAEIEQLLVAKLQAMDPEEMQRVLASDTFPMLHRSSCE